jgi:hypothetical protein
MPETGMATLTIEKSIGHAFADLPAVEEVHILNRGDILNVFAIVDDDEESVFDAIYARERVVINRFPEYHFDFNVIARRGRSLHELISLSTPVWQRHETDSPCPTETSI